MTLYLAVFCYFAASIEFFIFKQYAHGTWAIFIGTIFLITGTIEAIKYRTPRK